MIRRLVLLAALACSFPSPASAHEQPILGTMPPYPGATRPLPHWETANLAIALTPDKPEAVIGYYMVSLTRSGWTPAPGIGAEALAAAAAQEPAWLTFLKPGAGRLDIQITRGVHPGTKQPATLVFYQSTFKP
jgi:hypothetical protein